MVNIRKNLLRCPCCDLRLAQKKKRPLQDLNLRGQSPADFESAALTTRPNGQCFIHNCTCVQTCLAVIEMWKKQYI